MILDVPGTNAALRQRSCVRREWGAAPRSEAHRRVPHCTRASTGKYLARVDVAVPLGAQTEYATLDEEQLDKGDDAEQDVDEDGGGGIAEARAAVAAIVSAVISAGVIIRVGGAVREMGDGKDPAHYCTDDHGALKHEQQQCRKTETAVRRDLLGFQETENAFLFRERVGRIRGQGGE